LATRHLGVALIACGCAVLVPLAPRADAASSYVVRQGDSLWTIAARLHVGLERLLSVNHLTDASTIHPGERLVVPDAAAAPAPSGAPRATTYVVRAGDTLSAIAARMGVGVQPLAAANHLSLASTLHPGQTLVAPGAEASSASAPGPARIAAGPTRAIGSPVSDAPAHPAAAAGPTSVTATAPSQVARAQTASRAALAPVRTSLPSRGAAFTSAVVRTALRFLGRPYQWAGIGNRGFDCSGLVFRVFASMGLSVPHSSFDQFREGIAVPRWALSPGDLVFFHTYGYGASHVGIYVGGDRFVHASSDRGVVISSLSEPYYYYRYLGARRI
jgi:peptidoglycan endopeptidase LytE